MRNNVYNKAIFASMFLLALVMPAHAYIDAGTGSFAIQIIIAGALGGLFAIKSFWGNLVSRVLGRRTAKQKISVE